MSNNKVLSVVIQRLPISVTNALFAASHTSVKNKVPGEHTPIKCDFCHCLFKLKYNWDRHVKQHTGKGRFRCKQCDATFYCSALLKCHVKTHNKPRQCKVGYNTSAVLTSHMQSHKKDSPSSTSCAPSRNSCGVLSTSTTPFSTSTVLFSTSTVPFSTSTVPFSTSTVPCSTSTVPCSTSSIPSSTSSRPSSTSSGSSSTSSILSSTSYAPSSSSHAPLSTPHPPFKCQQFSAVFATSKELQLQTESKTSEHLEKSSAWLASIAEREKAKPKKALNIQKLLRMKKEKQLAILKSDLSIEAAKEESLGYESVMTVQEKLSKLFRKTFEIKPDDCGIKECLKPKSRNNVSQSKGRETDKEDNTSKRFHMKLPKVPKESKDKKSKPEDENMRDLHSQLFECELCQKVLVSKNSLQRHTKIHAGLKPFVCEICNRGYTEKYALRRHIKQVHENKKPFMRDLHSQLFECELCQKVLASKKSLQRHMKIHEGLKPFVCDICNQGYTNKYNLNKHKQGHKKLFQCQECHHCFSKKVNLQAHVRIKHLQQKSNQKCKGRQGRNAQ